MTRVTRTPSTMLVKVRLPCSPALRFRSEPWNDHWPVLHEGWPLTVRPRGAVWDASGEMRFTLGESALMVSS